MNNKPFFDFIRQLCGDDELETVISEMYAFLEVYSNSGKPDAIQNTEKYKSEVAHLSGRIESLNKENITNTLERSTYMADRNKLRQALLTGLSFVVDLPELFYDGYGKNLPKIGKYRVTKGLTKKILFYTFFFILFSFVINIFWTVYQKFNEFEAHKKSIEEASEAYKKEANESYQQVLSQQRAHAELNSKGIPYKSSNCSIKTGQFGHDLLLKPEKGSIKTGRLSPLKTYVVDSIVKNKRVGQDEYFYFINVKDSDQKGWLDIGGFDLHNDTRKRGDCF